MTHHWYNSWWKPEWLNTISKYCNYPNKELNPNIWGILFSLFTLIIISLMYYFTYDKTYDQNDEDRDVHIVDIMTITGTILIILIAYIYWKIFYVGKLIVKFPNTHIESHSTEAFLMYTFLYLFGIGIVMPLSKSIVSHKKVLTQFYPFYPMVFISMIVGYYTYELIKHGHNYIDMSWMKKFIKK